MVLQESGEMYLESILVLSRQKDHVRSIDVCDYLGYSKPSVSRAMSLLRKNGFILMDSDNYITLTESGSAVAEKIYERHQVLTKVLMSLGVDQQHATDDACKIEHVISDASFDAIKAHIRKHGE